MSATQTALRALAPTLVVLCFSSWSRPAQAESQRGPFFVEGHVLGGAIAFPSGATGASYPLEIAAGYHISGVHEGFVLGLAQRFDIGISGGSSGATLARLGWDFAIDLDPMELTIAPYLQGGAVYGFGGGAGGLVGMGVEGRWFPFRVYKPEAGEPVRVRTERVVVQADRIEIKEKIQFRVNEAIIESASFPLLDEIASVIEANPHIRRLRIEGHASSDGDAEVNRKLSQRRAEAVRKYLVDEGSVDASLLESEGYGDAQPIADNETEEGRERNRRVEFNILEQDRTKVEDKTVAVSGGPEEGFFVVAKPLEVDLLFVSSSVVPSLTFQAGVGIAF